MPKNSRWVSAAVMASLLPLSMASAQISHAAPAAPAGDRVEVPINSASPQKDIVESMVTIKSPAMSKEAHPAACDTLSYLRFRSATGPTDRMKADSVAVLMPGVMEGATAFDPVARNAIREAKRRGKNIEVWAIDRRANCLEDHTGVDFLEMGGDVPTALNYYFKGGSINGKKFAGFKPYQRFLADVGVGQTMNDYYTVLSHELPSQPWREKHVICGGHSLGGPLMTVFASWDMDGNIKTTEDAGYRQCAGWMGFDTMMYTPLTWWGNASYTASFNAMTAGLLSKASGMTVEAMKKNNSSQIALLGIGAETTTALEALSVLSSKTPDADCTPALRAMPTSGPLGTFLRLQGSGSLTEWLAKSQNIQDNKYTCMALLGQIMDDNAGAYGMVRSSFGFFTGAVRENNLAYQARLLFPLNQLLVYRVPMALPAKGGSVGWVNYNALGKNGVGFTNPGEEITDAADYARIVHETPMNFTENHFPMRIMLDLVTIAVGKRTGELSHSMHKDGIKNRPELVVLASNSVLPSTRPHPDREVLAQGYEHVDTITAAEKQNNGKPEIASQSMVNLMAEAVDGM